MYGWIAVNYLNGHLAPAALPAPVVIEVRRRAPPARWPVSCLRMQQLGCRGRVPLTCRPMTCLRMQLLGMSVSSACMRWGCRRICPGLACHDMPVPSCLLDSMF